MAMMVNKILMFMVMVMVMTMVIQSLLTILRRATRAMLRRQRMMQFMTMTIESPILVTRVIATTITITMTMTMAMAMTQTNLPPLHNNLLIGCDQFGLAVAHLDVELSLGKSVG